MLLPARQGGPPRRIRGSKSLRCRPASLGAAYRINLRFERLLSRWSSRRRGEAPSQSYRGGSWLGSLRPLATHSDRANSSGRVCGLMMRVISQKPPFFGLKSVLVTLEFRAGSKCTLFALDWIGDPALRRRANAGLNKDEARHPPSPEPCSSIASGESATAPCGYVWQTSPVANSVRPLRNPSAAFLDVA